MAFRNTPLIHATARSPLQHMAGVRMAAVIRDVRCHCCCCIDTTRHVIRFACQILRKVGLKPLEMVSTYVAVITCWHPCRLRRSKSDEKQTHVFDCEHKQFFQSTTSGWFIICSSRKMPKMCYMIRVVHDEQNKWHVLQMRLCHDDAISILMAWLLNRYL